MYRFHHLLVSQIKEHHVYESPDLIRRRAFLHAVSDVYYQLDADQAQLKRSLEASSNDLLLANTEMRAIIQALPDQFFRLDAEGTILDFRPGSGSHITINNEDPTAHLLYEFLSADVSEQFRDAIAKVLRSGGLRCFEFCEKDDRFLEVRMFPAMDRQVVALVRDISERKYSERRIAHLAYHDALTGLPNRALFKDRLELSIALARRYEHMVAVLFLDLDRFKQINDTLGHSIGDQVLVTIARRLRENLGFKQATFQLEENRAGLPVTIARMGGDEFTIILSEVKDVQEVVRVAQELLGVVSRPLNLSGSEVFVTVSIGITIFPVDGADFETLVKNADSAMYHAKEAGRNNYQLYTESMNAAAVERLMLENSLRRAVERNELEVYYQPQKELSSGRICGLEALVRWHHPEQGMIGPNIFIPLAEESDLILSIGHWIIREVCRQIQEWRGAGLQPCRVYVNISGHQVKPEHLVPLLADALSEHGLDSRYLGIELTETAMLADPEASAQVLRNVQRLGIKVAIDDFGTGYSGLSYLQTFAIDSLKIDQSFVRCIHGDPDSGDGRLASAIVALGHSLGLDVVAEGVETEAQLEFFKKSDCDRVQGYLLSHPRPAPEIVPFLEQTGPSDGVGSTFSPASPQRRKQAAAGPEWVSAHRGQ